MKKLFFWLFTLASILAVFITAIIFIALWLWFGGKQVEFELQIQDVFYVFISITALLFISLFVVFYKPLVDVKKLLSENPFSDIYAFYTNSFNPFISIKKAIKKNNDNGAWLGMYS